MLSNQKREKKIEIKKQIIQRKTKKQSRNKKNRENDEIEENVRKIKERLQCKRKDEK